MFCSWRKIDTGVLSHDNESAILLEEDSRMLYYLAGGNGLAAFDLKKREMDVDFAEEVANGR